MWKSYIGIDNLIPVNMVPGLFHLKKSLVVFVDTGLRNVGFNITFFFFFDFICDNITAKLWYKCYNRSL